MAADFMIQIRIAESYLRKEIRVRVGSIMISSRWINGFTQEETIKKFLLDSKENGLLEKLEEKRNLIKKEIIEASGLDEKTIDSLITKPTQIIEEETRAVWLKTGPKPQWFGGTHGKP